MAIFKMARMNLITFSTTDIGTTKLKEIDKLFFLTKATNPKTMAKNSEKWK